MPRYIFDRKKGKPFFGITARQWLDRNFRDLALQHPEAIPHISNSLAQRAQAIEEFARESDVTYCPGGSARSRFALTSAGIQAGTNILCTQIQEPTQCASRPKARRRHEQSNCLRSCPVNFRRDQNIPGSRRAPPTTASQRPLPLWKGSAASVCIGRTQGIQTQLETRIVVTAHDDSPNAHLCTHLVAAYDGAPLDCRACSRICTATGASTAHCIDTSASGAWLAQPHPQLADTHVQDNNPKHAAVDGTQAARKTFGSSASSR